MQSNNDSNGGVLIRWRLKLINNNRNSMSTAITVLHIFLELATMTDDEGITLFNLVIVYYISQ